MNTEQLIQEQAAMRERSNPAPEEVVVIPHPARKPDPDNEPLSNDVMVYVRHNENCNGKCEDGVCPRWFYDKSLGWKNGRRSARTKFQSVAEAEAKRIMEERDPKNRKIAELTRQRDYEAILITKATADYIQDCVDRGLGPETIEGYECALEHMTKYMHGIAIFELGKITPDSMKKFRSTWPKLGIVAKSSKNKIQRQIKTFFKNCCEQVKCMDINDNPALALTCIQGEEDVAALPFYDDQFEAIIDATWIYEDSNRFRDAALRLRALILLMRWSGLAIRDALTLPKWRIVDGILKGKRTKTKVRVEVALPADVIEVLEAAAAINDNPEYFFWNGTAKPRSLVGNYNRMLKRLFSLVKWPRPVEDGEHNPITPHSHMFRHTFAYWWLNTINPATGLLGDIRDLQILLGHKRLATTEKHYSGFMPDQNERLNQEVRARHAAKGARKSKPPQPEHHVRVRIKQQASYRAGGRGRFAR